jgi:phage shock protein PspC (stress-responsive transcriptional regulator)
MKKIININFHGRVVPIEETAYEILQQYIESLRKYFANEEGRDEIVNDIENRFAELFSECLKKGATCITDADVNTIITSMGRPEDFEQEDMTAPAGSNNGGNGGRDSAGSGQSYGSQQQGPSSYAGTEEPRRLYRSENDKILGGVCAGLANYLRLDPAIVRIIFAVFTLGGGIGFLLYIILWIAVPPKSLVANIRKRLYRNPDDRVIGGVASGLASYFHIDVWIPRLIFALPLIVGILTSIFRNVWFGFDPGAVFFTGGFGGSLFVTYIILWMVLPEASSASEKLEMRGEKVDLESIKNTIKSDLENFNKKAKDMGSQVKERFQQVGDDMKAGTRNFANEAAPVARNVGPGIGHAIGVLFKAFFLFIAGTITFALIVALIGLIFSGAGVLTFKNYIFSGFWQNILAWTSFVLFLVIPVVALLTWLIRRIIGVRSRSHYLGYTFASLWVIGLFCFIALVGMVLNNYRYRQHVEEDVKLSQPTHGRLVIKSTEEDRNDYDNDGFFDMGWGRNGVFYNVNEDSLIMNTIRVNLVKSPDSDYHVQLIKFSRGNSAHTARELAGQIVFNVRQSDSILNLPDGFSVTRNQHFRNQQVLVSVAIPVGRRILVDRSVDQYNWFNMNFNNRHFRWTRHWGNNSNNDWYEEGDDEGDWNNSLHWDSNKEYVMTVDGLSDTDKKHPREKENNEARPEQGTDNGGYRYHKGADSTRHRNRKDTAATGMTKKGAVTNTTGTGKVAEISAAKESEPHSYLISMLF